MKIKYLFLILVILSLILIPKNSFSAGIGGIPAVCGDGICDESQESWKNCAIDCLCPPGYDYNPITDQCEITEFSICGDSNIDPGEECDDSANNGPCPKTCSLACTINDCPPQAICGNGIKEAREQCDDSANNGPCPNRCSIVCRNNNCNSCPNNICGPTESCASCPQDCGTCPTCGNPRVCEIGDSCSCAECNIYDSATCQNFCVISGPVRTKKCGGRSCKSFRDCPSDLPFCVDSDGDGALDTCGACGGRGAAGRWDDCDSLCESKESFPNLGVCDGIGRCDYSISPGSPYLKTKCSPQGYIDNSGNRLFSTVCVSDDLLALNNPQNATVAIKRGSRWSCDFCNGTARYEGASCNLFDNFYGICDLVGGCVVSCEKDDDCPNALPYCSQFGVCDLCTLSEDPALLCQNKNQGYCDQRTGACIGTSVKIILTELNPSQLKIGETGLLRVYLQNKGISPVDVKVEINPQECKDTIAYQPKGEARALFTLLPQETKAVAFEVVAHSNTPCQIKVELYQQ